MNEERRNIINILRAIINISPRRGKSVRELEDEFFETAGYNIPTFEYENLEDFLLASDEFIIKNFSGGSMIYHRPKEESRHIAKFIEEKNISKRRFSVARRFENNLKQSVRQSRSVSSIEKINDTTPPKVTVIEYTFEQLKQKENRSEKIRFDGNATNEVSLSINSGMNQSSNQAGRRIQQSQDINLTDHKNEIRKLPPAVNGDLTLNKSGERNIHRNATTNQHNNQFMKQSSELQKDAKQVRTLASNPTNAQHISPILISKPCFDVKLPPPNGQSSLETSKMQFCKNVSFNYEGKSDCLARQTHPVIDLAKERYFNRSMKESPDSQQQESLRSKMVPSNSNEKCLLDYCMENQLGVPVFNLFQKNDRFQCYVYIDQNRYSTYPTYYESEIEARSETSKYAMRHLISLKTRLQKYDMCLDSEVELATKIYNCIKDFPAGVFLEKIPDKFLASYQQVMPPDWKDILAKFPCFNIDNSNLDISPIVYTAETSNIDKKLIYKMMNNNILSFKPYR